MPWLPRKPISWRSEPPLVNKPIDPVVAEFTPVPRHVAIIMDGNRRWAQQRGLPTAAGHRAGVEAVRCVVESCREQGVEVLTLFAFSSENWGRPETEVRALMALMCHYLRRETQKLQRDNVRLRFIGRRDRFSERLQRLMAHSEQATSSNSGATLVLAVDYGGRWDITNAARRLGEDVSQGKLHPGDINEQLLGKELALGDLPEPDLCIRTAGDQRVSNFMLWQFAYAEFYFVDTLWPDFDGSSIALAITDFRRRERRFGRREASAVLSGPLAGIPEI